MSTLNMVSIIRASRKNGRQVPWGSIIVATLKWIIPFKKGLQQRAFFSITSMLFHVCIIITPIFLGAHILLWERGVGIGWPAIGNLAADYLTLVAMVTGTLLFVQRVGPRESRAISRPQDYLLPLLIVIPFASGYLAMHPWLNPFDYTGTMFVHVMSGNLIFLLIPFTKISHVALFPGTQLVSELGWHLAPGAGQKIAATLGKENEPI
ncbi:MAG: hypothetical protein GY854_06255 [Deltaproteobacteria bacterium]|nr:hypothetical protein [Deltaproteobacteria bacterium]